MTSRYAIRTWHMVGYASLVGSIGPVATIFMAHTLLGESISALQIAGSVLAGVLTISVKNLQFGFNRRNARAMLFFVIGGCFID